MTIGKERNDGMRGSDEEIAEVKDDAGNKTSSMMVPGTEDSLEGSQVMPLEHD